MSIKFSQLPSTTVNELVAQDSVAVLHDSGLYKVPVSHATSKTTFGVSTIDNYGHVRLANSLNVSQTLDTDTIQNTALGVTGGRGLSESLIKNATFEVENQQATQAYRTGGHFFVRTSVVSQFPSMDVIAEATQDIAVGNIISSSNFKVIGIVDWLKDVETEISTNVSQLSSRINTNATNISNLSTRVDSIISSGNWIDVTGSYPLSSDAARYFNQNGQGSKYSIFKGQGLCTIVGFLEVKYQGTQPAEQLTLFNTLPTFALVGYSTYPVPVKFDFHANREISDSEGWLYISDTYSRLFWTAPDNFYQEAEVGDRLSFLIMYPCT